MKVVILGAAGFVGSSLIDKLVGMGFSEIIGVDDLSYGRMERLQGTLKDIDFYQESVEQFSTNRISGIDAIINCAAIAPLPENQISHLKSLSQNVATCGAICDFS